MMSRPVFILIAVGLAVAVSLAAGVLVARLDLHSEADVPRLVEKPLRTDWESAQLPDFKQHPAGTQRKAAFFGFLFPRVALANLEALRQREGVRALSRMESLSERQKAWLETHANRLRVSMDSDQLFDKLLRRLDLIPPSLMLAQAANESAWGTSRFAVKGNNLFGQWCFTRGCGIVPSRRGSGMSHEVAAFDHPYASIRGYITNLNRHQAYTQLRRLRSQQRARGSFPEGLTLAGGLEKYSERGQAYVNEIRSMITHNNLLDYDARLQAIMGSEEPLKKLNQDVRQYREQHRN